MIVDVYKRPEDQGTYSYLVVPDGQEIPQEVTNTDWINDDKRIDISGEMSDVLNIHEMESQIEEKGYAISNVDNYVKIGADV